MKPPIDMNRDYCLECRYHKMPHYECTHFMYHWFLERHEQYGRTCPLFEKQAQPDYKGVLKGGRCIVFDTKETTTDKISISALSETQKETLLNYSSLGAVSGVLMAYNFTRFYFLPIDIFLSAKQLNKHQYWTAYEAEKQVEPIKYQGTNLDFLKNIMSGDDC